MNIEEFGHIAAHCQGQRRKRNEGFQDTDLIRNADYIIDIGPGGG